MDSTNIFAKMPPLRLFFYASIPGAVSMLASSLYQTIDGMLVGQYLGETAFAAINLAMPKLLRPVIIIQCHMLPPYLLIFQPEPMFLQAPDTALPCLHPIPDPEYKACTLPLPYSSLPAARR